MKRRQICHAHFPHVRDSRVRVEQLDLKPTLIKYNARKKGFCFSYKPSVPRGPYGQKGR